MIAQRDYYEVLGVPRDADAKTIKNAFRQLARRYHPDISTEPDAEQRFKESAEAYGVLSDPARHADYDAQGFSGLAGATAEDVWGGIDFADIFGSGAPAFSGLFERVFGMQPTALRRGEDVRTDLVIGLDEVLTGGKQAVTIRRLGPCPRCAGRGSRPGTAPRRCPQCAGTGQLAGSGRIGPMVVRRVTTCPQCDGRGRIIDEPCPACAASGTAVREETVTIRIPPGIPDGAALRLAGHGMPSPMPGGLPGDAYVTIRTRADPRFARVGADLWYNLHVEAPDAALGLTAAIPVPGGQARVRIPPGTQPGSVLRVTGRGLPHHPGPGRGSLNVTVTLDIPRLLSSRQRQLYEQLRSEHAEIRSEAAGSPEPGAPRSGGTQKAHAGRRYAQGQGFGLVIFAAVLLGLVGVFNLIAGIAAITSSHVFTAGAHYAFADLRTWGWITLIIAVLQLLAAAGMVAGSQLARWSAVAVLGLNAIGQMFFLPGYPLWSLTIIAADIVAIWGLCAYGSPEKIKAARPMRRGGT